MTHIIRTNTAVLRVLLKPAVVLTATFACAIAVVKTSATASQLSVLAAIPLLFVLPGYAVSTALFPTVSNDGGRDGTAYIERIALSLVGSVLTTTFVGFGFVVSPLALTRESITFALTLITVVAALLAARAKFRRSGKSQDGSLNGPLTIFHRLRRQSISMQLVTVLLLTSLVFAGVAASYALSTEIRSEQYTEFYLLSENESGQLVADGYPTEFTQNRSRTLTVGVANREQQAVEYNVVVTLQRIRRENNHTRVIEGQKLDRYQMRLRASESANRTIQIRPSLVGQDLRLAFFLYTDAQPELPSEESAYRDTHLWINVTEQTDDESQH